MMPDNKKQWFLLLLTAAWLLLSAVAYVATQDARIATLIAPPIAMLCRLYHYHFPPSIADYELQKFKLQIKRDQACNRKRARP